MSSAHPSPKAIALFVAFVVLASFMIGRYRLIRVNSGSMEPTICAGDTLLFATSLADHPYVRGEIVLALAPNGEKIVKRLVGMGGDAVVVRNRQIATINNRTPIEPYACFKRAETDSRGSDRSTSDSTTRIDERYVYLAGDNRDESIDSRAYGSIPQSSVGGYLQMDLSAIFGNRCLCSSRGKHGNTN